MDINNNKGNTMRRIILVLVLLSCATFAQGVKTNVTTSTKTVSEVTTVKVDSVDLERFIKAYLDRNSVTSTYTVAQIDAAIGRASQTITTGTVTASGMYVTTSSNSVPSTRQLYYKPILLNGVIIGRYLTTEMP